MNWGKKPAKLLDKCIVYAKGVLLAIAEEEMRLARAELDGKIERDCHASPKNPAAGNFSDAQQLELDRHVNKIE